MKPTTGENPLKAWLERKGITREELANQIGRSTPFVIDLVNGKHGDLGAGTVDQLHLVTGIPHKALHAWLRTIREESK